MTIVFFTLLAACAGPSEQRPGRTERAERPEMTPERRAEMLARFLDRWDLNGDGAVTCADIEFQRARLFALLDADENQELASGEYRYAKFEDKSFLFHLFTDVDADRSGAVSLEELQAVVHSQFSGLDKDGDCIVSEEEAAAAIRERVQEARGERDGRRGRGGRGPGGQRPDGRRPGGVTDTAAP